MSVPLNDRRDTLRRLAGGWAALAGAGLLAACGDRNAPATPAAAAPAPAAAPTGEAAYTLAATGHGFTRGAMMAANTVYVFFDATCPHCAELWQSSQPLLNRIKFVWMPVGLLRSSSGPQGGTILAAKDPIAAMEENEKSVLARGGGITVDPGLSQTIKDQVAANTELFNKLGANSVPLIVFRNAQTGQYGQHAGFVETPQLAAMLGI